MIWGRIKRLAIWGWRERSAVRSTHCFCGILVQFPLPKWWLSATKDANKRNTSKNLRRKIGVYIPRNDLIRAMNPLVSYFWLPQPAEPRELLYQIDCGIACGQNVGTANSSQGCVVHGVSVFQLLDKKLKAPRASHLWANKGDKEKAMHSLQKASLSLLVFWCAPSVATCKDFGHYIRVQADQITPCRWEAESKSQRKVFPERNKTHIMLTLGCQFDYLCN